MKEGRFAVALITNQDEGFTKFVTPVQTVAHHFFQQGPDFRIIASQPVQSVIQKFITCGGVVRPRNLIGDHNIRCELAERIITDVVKAVAEGNHIGVGDSGFSLCLEHHFQIGQDF